MARKWFCVPFPGFHGSRVLGIKELAKHLNISIGTVSRALNNHPEVNAQTRQRVLEAAERLGYAPDQAARGLRKGVSGTVAFVMSTDCTGNQNAIFFMELCRGIRETLERHDMDLVIHLAKPDEGMIECVRRIVERRQADGLILAETKENDARLDFLVKRNFPFVTLGRSRSGGEHPWGDLDFEGAMRVSVERLASMGHRRIALAVSGERRLMLDQVMVETFKAEMARHGLPVDPDWIRASDSDESGGYRATDEILRLPERPTAMLFPHYAAVVGAYSRLAEAGLRPGSDIAIISFSADTPMAQFLTPSLTCFRLDFLDLGERLAEALLTVLPRFADDFCGRSAQFVQPWTLIPRESDAPAPR